MKERTRQVLQHPLIYGSGIVFVGNLFGNFFNFLFNLFMSRTLTVSDYGILASVVALISFPNLAAAAIIPMVVHFAGSYFAKGQLTMVRGLYLHLFKFLVTLAVILCLLLLLSLSYLKDFFHIDDTIILLLTNATIFLIFINVINIAFLQAKLAFVFQVIVNIVSAVCKLALGVLFVFMGFSVPGAVAAIFFALVAGYGVSFFQLGFIFDRKISPPKIATQELFHYGLPSTITLIGLTSFISTDIILVKHFFEPTMAGLYAGLSLIGRVIFYLSAPIGSVMFPVIVQKFSKNENVTNTFKLSLLIVFIPSFLLTLFYYLFPEFTILFFLKKTEYLSLTPVLWIFGAFMTLYCILTILSNFYLSIKRTKVFIPIVIGALVQIVLIIFYHTTILQVTMISLIITFLLVVILLLYYPYAIKK